MYLVSLYSNGLDIEVVQIVSLEAKGSNYIYKLLVVIHPFASQLTKCILISSIYHYTSTILDAVIMRVHRMFPGGSSITPSSRTWSGKSESGSKQRVSGMRAEVHARTDIKESHATSRRDLSIPVSGAGL